MRLEKFSDSHWTAKNEKRASVSLKNLETLWFNTGTRCNLSCENCYIESDPKNDRLSFLTGMDVQNYLEEIGEKKFPVREIGLTGGEPFINPHIVDIIERCLSADFKTLVLTNAFRIERVKKNLLDWKNRFGDKLVVRVSLDHYTKKIHELERGVDTFEPTLKNIKWLADNGIKYAVAGRSLTGEDSQSAKLQYQKALEEKQISIDIENEESLVIFAEMDPKSDVPEITTECWQILDKSPDDVMCSSSRMVVKRKGEVAPKVLACTLLAYDRQFELGESLEEAHTSVSLNHPFCSQFCVLGGSSCS